MPIRLTLVVLSVGAILLVTLQHGTGPNVGATGTSLTEIRKLLASDGDANDSFGRVAISGDVAVVGAKFKDAAFTAPGAAYIFQRDAGGAGAWGEAVKLTASDAQHGDLFGGDVAISGDTIVVGAELEDSGGLQAGAAYIFQRDEGGPDNWGEVAKLTASDAELGDNFGRDVAISGDTVLAGVNEKDANAGAAYLFQRNEGGADNWGEVKKLTASDGQADDRFGSVSVSGDTAIIGASGEDTAGLDAGAAYVFQRNEGGADNWGEVKKLTASDAGGFDLFGTTAISGDTAVVGALRENAGGADAGAAYVFQRDEGGAGNWGEVEKLTASDAQANDLFGIVAISGDIILVGAVDEDHAGSSSGAAYVFGRDEGGVGNWGQVYKLTASDAEAFDKFGHSVATSGDGAIVGAPQEGSGGSLAGAAYVFDLRQPKKLPHPGDTDGDGCSDQQENGLDASLGGLRDYLNPWDFYDVAIAGAVQGQDGQVDLFNDIVSVIDHYAPVGTEPEYDAFFDRGPSAGPNQWNMTAPDGKIDLFNDIVGVISQFGHDCR